ncbi:Metallophosphoesterase [Frankia sp. AiPs1]|uniref:metallophosphoesterase family protein n=1 Tax=Frankia sp. AiPa1 TaxID=573492 RepID=UPI00202B5E58|nr:metallophosphoesterase family protein [Frankia sp. AiPa1]MCL9762891.1 metallophosphatase family protein [Frankia sp. AiPa1]
MRYALFADLHGRPKALDRLVAATDRAGVAELVCLGDYLEANVSRRRHDPSRWWRLPQVVDPDPALWSRLAGVRRIRGNQEERIHALLRPEQLPPGLAAILDAPAFARLHGLVGLHGHQIRWTVSADSDSDSELLVPVATDVPRLPVVVVGHTHQNALFEIHWPATPADEPRVRVIPVQPEQVLRLSVDAVPAELVRAELGRLGLAAPAGPTPTPTPTPPTDPTPPTGTALPSSLVPPAGTAVAAGTAVQVTTTVLINVGPARGHTQNWLEYDTDRGEISFRSIVRSRKEPGQIPPDEVPSGAEGRDQGPVALDGWGS